MVYALNAMMSYKEEEMLLSSGDPGSKIYI
jgi:hypothetical protein